MSWDWVATLVVGAGATLGFAAWAAAVRRETERLRLAKVEVRRARAAARTRRPGTPS